MEQSFQENPTGSSSYGNAGNTQESGGSSVSKATKYHDRKQKLQETKAVSEYLKFLNKDSQKAEAAVETQSKPRVRKTSPEALKKQIMRTDEKINSADVLMKLDLAQKRIELEKKLNEAMKQSDMPEHDSGMSEKERLEKDFIENAKTYGERKGLSYDAWRRLNVPAAILKKAGIPRGNKA